MCVCVCVCVHVLIHFIVPFHYISVVPPSSSMVSALSQGGKVKMLWPTCTIHPCLTIITIECFTFTFNFYFDQSKLDNNGPSAKRPRLATTAAPSRPSDVQVSPVARRCNSSIHLLYFVSHYAYCSGTVQPRLSEP